MAGKGYTENLRLRAKGSHVVAGIMQAEIEAYNKYRRTNVPSLIPYRVPVRIPYPRSEQTFNEANVLAAVAANGGEDSWDGRPGWDASDQSSGPAN